MKTMLARAALWLFATMMLAAPVLAGNAVAPAGDVPTHAIAYGTLNGAATNVDATHPLPVLNSPTGSATGGLSVSSKIVAANTTSVAIDASPGTLYGVTVFNNSAVIHYLKLYNTAQGSVTCGSGTPVQRIMIPASTSGAGAVIPFPLGMAYSTAITSCVTAALADNDTTNPTASSVLIEFTYK